METKNKNTQEESVNIQIESHFEQIHTIIDIHRSRALQTVNSESLLIWLRFTKPILHRLFSICPVQ